MAGTYAGGKKANATIKKTRPDFYKRIGALGGKVSKGGGFTDPEKARAAGQIGGRMSRRPKKS